MARKPKIPLVVTEYKHRCPFCEAKGKRVETEIGSVCPVCGHYCTCERKTCPLDCYYFGDTYNVDGACLAHK